MRSPVWILLSGIMVSCAGASATQEQQQAAERRLLAPYLRDTEVSCGELLVEIQAYATYVEILAFPDRNGADLVDECRCRQRQPQLDMRSAR